MRPARLRPALLSGIPDLAASVSDRARWSKAGAFPVKVRGRLSRAPAARRTREESQHPRRASIDAAPGHP
ncbi:hypothetical protein Agsp01_09030 [Agromyces sp. NBRC 114283]|nr:hypothetical protein Agsp01_09030 [Agromyces sp. NBRC 114283]